MRDSEITEALRSLIRGEGVGRATHALSVDGQDFTAQFKALLEAEGFRETRIDELDIQPGERVPAFHAVGSTAHFGWVFWEVFEPGRRRKIFGSVMKNVKGDWSIILGRSSRVWANQEQRETMDVEKPSSF